MLYNEIQGPLLENQKITLEKIQKNAEDLLNLVNEILDFSKIESGKLSIVSEPVEMAYLIEDIVSRMKPLFEEKSLDVQFNKNGALPSIQSDPGKIKQILVNLLSNAVKFTRKGGISIETNDLPEREEIKIVIHDTGIGISEEELPKIFEPFHQVDNTSTREFGGVGLGLAIVKELIDLLRGTVEVESEFGKGTAFSIYLPYRLKERRKGVASISTA